MKPRLLIVELHHLGDAVLSLPFVRAAQRDYEVHVLCRPATRAIYQLLAHPPKVHHFEPPWVSADGASSRESLSAARLQGRVLRPLEFAVAVSAWADARVEALLWETRARERISFPMTRANYYASDLPWRRRRRWLGRLLEIAWRLRWPAQPLLTRSLHRRAPDQHHLRSWEQIAGSLDLSWDERAPWMAADPVASALKTTTRPLLAVHTRARLPSKQWPLASWRQLLAHPEVTKLFEVVEILPPGTEPLDAGLARPVVTSDIGALASALAASDAVLCHDSLPAHLAAALGRPVVTIFGSGEPDWFAPWGQHERVVQRRVCPLHPCIDQCGMDRYVCLEAITLDDVLHQLHALPFGS